MQYNAENLPTLLERSGVTHSDIARILGVSRVTVYNWCTPGKSDPHRMIQKKAQALFRAIASAADAGDLPIPTRRVEARLQALKPILAQHLAAVAGS